MPTSATTIYNRNRLTPAYPAFPAPTVAIKLPANKTLVAGQILGELIGNNEVQVLTPGGTISGGTWTITFGGQTTSNLAFNANAAAIQAALEALSSIGTGNVVVTGGPISSGTVTLTFQGALGNTNVAQVTCSAASLTGSSPTLTPSTTTQGSAGTAGTFDVYSASATNGQQIPSAILEFDTQTDASGNVIYENGRTATMTTAFVGGAFNTADLTGLTPACITARSGCHFLTGTQANGGVISW